MEYQYFQDFSAPLSNRTGEERFHYNWRSSSMAGVAMSATVSRYVTRNPNILSGEPTVAATRIPVRAIVGLWRLGTPPEEIPTQFSQLTLAQVFDALSFYLDNEAEINDYIERNQIPDDLIHPAVRKVLEAE
jgi:uncharacterized protein (DUF433 family)